MKQTQAKFTENIKAIEYDIGQLSEWEDEKVYECIKYCSDTAKKNKKNKILYSLFRSIEVMMYQEMEDRIKKGLKNAKYESLRPCPMCDGIVTLYEGVLKCQRKGCGWTSPL